MRTNTVFPRLQTLEIDRSVYIPAMGGLLREIINSAPSLLMIIFCQYLSMEIIKLLPPEQFHLVKQLFLDITSVEVEEVYRKLCGSPLALESLQVVSPRCKDFEDTFSHILDQLLQARF